MSQIFSIMRKDILQWTRRPLYFIASTTLAILIISVVGNTIAGANDMPFGLYDPASISGLSQRLASAKRFRVIPYDDINKAKTDLRGSKIIALADVSQDPLEDNVQIFTEGHNPMIQLA
jgi:hypothetical protein